MGPAPATRPRGREVKEHFDYFCQMVDFAINEYTAHSPLGVKLVVGPEQALLGWPSTSAREMHEKYAIEIPGPETGLLVEKAREHDCYLSPGSVVERDPESCAPPHLQHPDPRRAERRAVPLSQGAALVAP